MFLAKKRPRVLLSRWSKYIWGIFGLIGLAVPILKSIMADIAASIFLNAIRQSVVWEFLTLKLLIIDFEKSQNNGFHIETWMILGVAFIVSLLLYFSFRIGLKRRSTYRDEQTRKKLEELCNDMEDVDGIVIYRYQITKLNAVICNFVNAYAEPGISLNTIYREICNIPKNLAKPLENMASHYNEYLNVEKGRCSSLRKKDNRAHLQSAKDIALRIKSIAEITLFDELEIVTEEKCCAYQIYRLASEIIYQNVDDPNKSKNYFDFFFTKDRREYELKLMNAKRTWIIGSAYNNETRLFANEKTIKKDRVYVVVKARDYHSSESFIFQFITNSTKEEAQEDITKYEEAVKHKFGTTNSKSD